MGVPGPAVSLLAIPRDPLTITQRRWGRPATTKPDMAKFDNLTVAPVAITGRDAAGNHDRLRSSFTSICLVPATVVISLGERAIGCDKA